MLDNKRVSIDLDNNYSLMGNKYQVKYFTIYTGPLDRIFKFKGTYKYIYQKFTKTKGYDYSDFKVFEGAKSYLLSDNQKSGNYNIKETNNDIEIKVYQKSKNSWFFS